MAVEQGITRAETYQEQGRGRFISNQFVEKAPTDRGTSGLMDWLEQNLGNEVRKAVAGEMGFWPLKVTDLLRDYRGNRYIQDALLGFPKTVENMVINGLLTYASYQSLLSRRELERSLGEQTKSSHTLEKLRESVSAAQELLREMGLIGEVRIIDYLFEKARSVPAQRMDKEKIGKAPPFAAPRATASE